jgi:hypothetical protein
MLLIGAVAVTLWTFAEAKGSGPALALPEFDHIATVGFIVLLFSAVFLSFIGEKLQTISRAVRLRLRPHPLAKLEKLRRDEFASDIDEWFQPRTNWLRPSELASIPVVIRPAMRRTGLVAEMAERSAVVMGLAALLSGALWIALPLLPSNGDDPAVPDLSVDENVIAEPGIDIEASEAIADGSTPEPAAPDQKQSPTWLWGIITATCCLVSILFGASSQDAGGHFARYMLVGLGYSSEDQFIEGEIPSVEMRRRSWQIWRRPTTA